MGEGREEKIPDSIPSEILFRGFAAMVFQLQIKLIKIKLLSLLTHSKFHELQFV